MAEVRARISEQLKNRLDTLIFQRKSSQQAAIVRGLEMWAESGGAPLREATPYDDLTEREDRILRGVLALLRSPESEHAAAIKKMLMALAVKR